MPFASLMLSHGLVIIRCHWRVLFFFFSVIKKDTRGAQQPFPPKYNENTFKAVQSTFRSLEKFSKRRCKICICSVIQGELESSLF